MPKLRVYYIMLLVVLGLSSFAFVEKQSGEYISVLSGISVFIGIIILMIFLFKSVFTYFKTKDKSFLTISVIYIITFVLVAIYCLY